MPNHKVCFDMSVGGAPAGRVGMELFADVTPKTAEHFKALYTGELGVGKSAKMPNPKVCFDMSVGDAPAGRVAMELFADVTPKTAENFKALYTGELGVGKSVPSEVMKVDEFWFPVSIAPEASRDLCHLGYEGNGGNHEIQEMMDALLTIRPIGSHPLQLVGHGITDISILTFLKIRFTAIGVYLNREVASHLQKWKGKSGAEIFADDVFFYTLCGAPVEKFIAVKIIKELKGAQYGLNLEMKDRLAAIGKFEEGEREGLEKLVEFFQGKYLNKKSLITFNFPASNKAVEVSFFPVGEKKKSAKTVVENGNVAAMIMKYYLGGSKAISKTTITTLADGMAALLK